MRFDRLPDIPVKVEVLVPTSNFPEPVSNWDLWMEVEPGKFKIAKIYGGADAVGTGWPPAPEELRQGETVYYSRLVVRPTFRLNIKDWQRIDSSGGHSVLRARRIAAKHQMPYNDCDVAVGKYKV